MDCTAQTSGKDWPERQNKGRGSSFKPVAMLRWGVGAEESNLWELSIGGSSGVLPDDERIGYACC